MPKAKLDGKRGVFVSPNGRNTVVLCARHRSKHWKWSGSRSQGAADRNDEFSEARRCEACFGRHERIRDAFTGRLQPWRAAKKGRKR